jgi:hypothetical protein
MYDLSVLNVHYADRVGWDAVVAQYEFCYPEITAAQNSPDSETLLVRLQDAALLDVPPPSNALARLRVFEHCVVVIDFMLGIEVAFVGSFPMPLQGQSHVFVIHLDVLAMRSSGILD